MAKKRTSRQKASPKSANRKSAKSKSSPKASEEFGGEFYASDDWKALKKKHPGGFEATLEDLEKKEWDDGSAWYAQLEGHEKLAKINRPSGRVLAEVFGNDMNSWKGRRVHVTPMNYNTGWGAVIDPIEDEDDTDDDVTLEEDDEDID